MENEKIKKSKVKFLGPRATKGATVAEVKTTRFERVPTEMTLTSMATRKEKGIDLLARNIGQ